MLLVICDYFSNYIEVERLQTATTKAVIKVKTLYSRYGVSDTLVTENGPQFSSAEFMAFSKAWGFQHVTSSPHYPQSNSKVGNAVKTVKQLFTKCQELGQSEYWALLEWRNTPTEGVGTSPVQRFLGRHYRTILLLTQAHLPSSGTPLLMMHRLCNGKKGSKASTTIAAAEISLPFHMELQYEYVYQGNQCGHQGHVLVNAEPGATKPEWGMGNSDVTGDNWYSDMSHTLTNHLSRGSSWSTIGCWGYGRSNWASYLPNETCWTVRTKYTEGTGPSRATDYLTSSVTSIWKSFHTTELVNKLCALYNTHRPTHTIVKTIVIV